VWRRITAGSGTRSTETDGAAAAGLLGFRNPAEPARRPALRSPRKRKRELEHLSEPKKTVSSGTRHSLARKMTLSIILPAKNEAASLEALAPKLRASYPDAEILVVNDGSTDTTVRTAEAAGLSTTSHPYSMGNGAAIKTGARLAKGDVLVFMDADGQHDPADIERMLAKMGEGYEMVVGARSLDTHASTLRRIANTLFNGFASYMTSHPIHDLTSGFRAVRARHFRKFLYLLPNRFSYPTTITVSFIRSGLPIAYVPIRAANRTGKSHIRPLTDGLRFLLIISKIGALFSPMRLFLPVSVGFFLLGLGHYGYTFFTMHRFTNMSALLFIASILTFLIGIVSEQIASLHYLGVDSDVRRTVRDR
jgi:glycosyltransferase involved in cell wall biosynthesis